jgi:hypothetical protein
LVVKRGLVIWVERRMAAELWMAAGPQVPTGMQVSAELRAPTWMQVPTELRMAIVASTVGGIGFAPFAAPEFGVLHFLKVLSARSELLNWHTQSVVHFWNDSIDSEPKVAEWARTHVLQHPFGLL